MKDTLAQNGENLSRNGLDQLFELNSLTEYLVGIALVIGAIVIVKIVQRILRNRFASLGTGISEFVEQLILLAYPLLYVLIIFLVFNYYSVTPRIATIAAYSFKVAFILLTIRVVAGSIRAAIYGYLRHQDESGEKIKQVRGIVLILGVVVWLLGLIFMFDNLGFNVTAVLTGLGVGGIAIALAAQTILGDIFNYFVIFFDRPFEVGDFIIVDDKMGVVEYIGIKTTRLKSLSGEQLVFSNSNLTNSRIHNYKRMNERRVVFQFGVVYATSRTQLEQLPRKLQAIVTKIPDTRFDRAHLARFASYSIDFEVVYYVLSADYNHYMDIQQRINLEIFDLLESEDIRFAMPTYTIKTSANDSWPENMVIAEKNKRHDL